MKDEGGETTEGREGSRGTVRKAAASRHPSQKPVPIPAPLILPFFRPPSLVFPIPSEVTTACMSKRRYRAARGLATATPLEVTFAC